MFCSYVFVTTSIFFQDCVIKCIDAPVNSRHNAKYTAFTQGCVYAVLLPLCLCTHSTRSSMSRTWLKTDAVLCKERRGVLHCKTRDGNKTVTDRGVGNNSVRQVCLAPLVAVQAHYFRSNSSVLWLLVSITAAGL